MSWRMVSICILEWRTAKKPRFKASCRGEILATIADAIQQGEPIPEWMRSDVATFLNHVARCELAPPKVMGAPPKDNEDIVQYIATEFQKNGMSIHDNFPTWLKDKTVRQFGGDFSNIEKIWRHNKGRYTVVKNLGIKSDT